MAKIPKWQLEADIHFEAADFPAACRLLAEHFEDVAKAFEEADAIPNPTTWYHGHMLLRAFEDPRWRWIRDGSF